MKIQGNYTSKLTETAWTRPAATAGKAQKTAPQRFDSVLISTSETAKQDGIRMELRSRLAQEVKTATSSGMVFEVQEQIKNGTYRVEPMEIARKMLLAVEA